MRVLVTGGRGVVGRLLVPRLLASGHDVEVSSRRSGTGPGGVPTRVLDLTAPIPDGTLDGFDVVVHAATNPARTKTVDVEGTSAIVQAAGRAGVGHLIYLSIVGIDGHPFPYYRAKVAAEHHVVGHTGHTILRTTQFHEFLDRIFSTGPVVAAFRGVEFQVIDGGVVADRLVELVAVGPGGRVADMGGPQSERMTTMAASWKEASASRKPVIRLPVFGRAARAFKAKQHHTPNATPGSPTWDEWLTRRYGS